MKFSHIILSIGACLTMAACSQDFLDVKPQGSLNDAVLTSSDGVGYLVASAYAALQGPAPTFGAMNSPVNHWLEGELHADNALLGGPNANFERVEQYILDGSVSLMNSWWTALYQSVKRTNMALQVLNTCSEADVPDVELLKAEMRALRAHYYFELSRHFNKIAWIDETLTEDEYISVRNDEFTRDQILEKIAKEFEAVIPILPETQAELGRITKHAAEAYAAKVSLYKAYRQDPSNNQVTTKDQNDLNKVVEYTGKVISSGKYGLLDDFQKLMTTDVVDG